MRGIRANLKSSLSTKQQSPTVQSNLNEFKSENEKIKKETEELIEKTKKAINDLNKQGTSEEVKMKRKEKKFEEVIRTKSKSPSKGNETKLVMEKFDNTLINSQANLKSK